MDKLDITTPYMLRNDGELLTCGTVHPYILMSINSPITTNIETLKKRTEFLEWFRDNTLNDRTKELVNEVMEGNYSEEILKELNDLTNQEFCRVRTSNYKVKYGGDNGEIYFRVCSEGFNWFDLIWKVVSKFAPQIKYVTIMKDRQSLGGDEFNYYKVKDYTIKHLPVDIFLTLGGEPIIEGDRKMNKAEELENFIEDLYDLRKQSIATEGEYGLGNLVFKEFRNLGYLDNLKDLVKQEKSKELSLENIE